MVYISPALFLFALFVPPFLKGGGGGTCPRKENTNSTVFALFVPPFLKGGGGGTCPRKENTNSTVVGGPLEVLVISESVSSPLTSSPMTRV